MPVVPPEQLANCLVIEAMKELGRQSVLSLERYTPKDTKLASVSWIPDLGLGDRTPIRPPKTRFGRQGFAALQRARRDLGLARIRTFNIAHGQISINNNLPYIRRLENGHSQQAPNGFIERALCEALVNTRLRLISRFGL